MRNLKVEFAEVEGKRMSRGNRYSAIHDMNEYRKKEKPRLMLPGKLPKGRKLISSKDRII